MEKNNYKRKEYNTVPNISEVRESRFLKKEDCPLTLTIARVSQENVGLEGKEDLRWVLLFNETEKGMIINTTNAQIMADNFGSDEMDDWAGKKVHLYNDKNVMFAGKRVGGIRVLDTSGQTPPNKPEPQEKYNGPDELPEDDDLKEVPF